MFFKKAYRVNYYDCDRNNRLKLSAAMRYMQETSSEQMEDIGVSAQKLLEEHMVFLLTKSCIKINRMPLCREPIVVGAAAVAIRGVRFAREFIMETPEGERLVSAMTLWVLVDPATRRILRPKIFPYELHLQEETLGEIISNLPMPKTMPEAWERRTDVQIRYSHLDVNDHVNNSYYGDFLCDAIPYTQLIEHGLDTVVISFQHEARWGETLEISTQGMGEREYHVCSLHGDGNACFEAYAKLK